MDLGIIITVVIAIVAAVVVLSILRALASIYRQVPPNKALIVYGWGGTQMITEGGKLVFPMLQNAHELSLELMSFNVSPEQALYTSQGVALHVNAVAQIKVRSDPDSIRTAAEQFLSKSEDERQDMIRLVMEGHLRNIVGLLTVEQIVKEPERVTSQVRATVTDDLSKMGLEVVSFTIKRVMDDGEYIRNMGRPDQERIKRQAEIAAAEAERDVAIKKAEALREAAVVRALAEQEQALAEAAAETKRAEATRDRDLKVAAYKREVQEQAALADAAYDIASNQARQKKVAAEVEVERVRKEGEIAVQEMEVRRRERELEATVVKAAEAEQRRVAILAEAERQRRVTEAAGIAQATQAQGEAEARVIGLRGTAEAEVVRAKGEAEADAMEKRAAAYESYTQAALLDKLLGSMPELAKPFADALNKVDKITIVSTGDGNGGVSNLTGEMGKMAAQLPAVVENLTGLSIQEMLRQLRGMPSSTQRNGDSKEGMG